MTLKDDSLDKLTTWAAGINNVAPITDLPDGSLREALNLDLTDSGKPRRRKGFTSVYAGTNIHGLKTSGALTVFVEDGTLKQLETDDTVRVLQTGMGQDNNVAYAEHSKYLYFSNGDTLLGRINNTSYTSVVEQWPVPKPASQLYVSANTWGGMDEGRYLVTHTNVNSSLEESPALRSVAVDVPAGGGIAVTGLPTNYEKIVYVTKANGTILYEHIKLAAVSSSVNITNSLRHKRLRTQNLEPLPAGHIMFFAFGRMWVVKGNLLIYSKPFNFGLYDPAKDFFHFPQDIDIAIPIEDGIYVCSSYTSFLRGTNPMQMEQMDVYPAEAVRGTGLRLNSKVFNLDVKEDVAYWFSSKGAVLGLPEGQIMPIMEDRVAVPLYEIGASMYRAEDGIQQVVSAVRDPGQGSSLGTSDSASAYIVRNGVVIQ